LKQIINTELKPLIMKSKHSKRLMMFENVIRVMDTHFKTWSGVPELSRSYDRFVKRYKKMKDLKQEETHDLKPLVDHYMKKRKVLVNKLFPLASVTAVYASDTGKDKLEKSLNLSKNQLTKSKDAVLAGASARIIKVAAPSVVSGKGKKRAKSESKSISDYGVTDAMTTELATARIELLEARKAIKDAENDKYRCAKEIARISRANKKLLENRLDRLVGLFQEKNGEFYQSYIEARGLAKKEKTSEEKQPEKSSPAAKLKTQLPPASKSTTRKQPASRAAAGKATAPKSSPVKTPAAKKPTDRSSE
jgi:hypothetical protein